MKEYDLAVIGGGPAGYLAAERARDTGLSVLLAEKRTVGGVCLNEGCIPTKTFLYSGKQYESMLHGKEKGVLCASPSLDHKGVLTRKQTIVKALVSGLSSTLNRKGVDVLIGEASVSKNDNNFDVCVDKECFQANNILVATGSAPIIPPIPGAHNGIENGSILTSRELLDIDQIPDSLVIIGAGVIGLEMAEYFATAGSKVTIIEMLNSIGGELDSDAATELQNILEKKGITFHLQSKVVSLERNQVVFEKNNKSQTLSYDKALLSVGRKAVTNGLEALNLYMKNGALVTDSKCATNICGVYAAGDVNGKYMLAHVAYREAEVAVSNIAGKADFMNYSAIPAVIYTNPEVSFVGMTQSQAQNAGYTVDVHTAAINLSGRHVAEQGISNGFCKLIIDKEKDLLLGAVLVCAYAAEIIYPLTLMIQNKIPLQSIKRTIFPHPTVCEIIREAIFSK